MAPSRQWRCFWSRSIPASMAPAWEAPIGAIIGSTLSFLGGFCVVWYQVRREENRPYGL